MPEPAPATAGRLMDKVALITGASRGIGRSVAVRYAAEGAHVVLLARTTGGLEETDDAVRAAGGAATLVSADVMDFPAIDRLGAALYERHGRLDVLVGNAAALGTLGPLAHTAPETWDEVIATNLTANWRLIRSLDPLLRAAPAGRAIFVTSGAARLGIAYWGAYATSKAGLEMLVRTYAAEVAKTRVRVNLLDPGVVRTATRARAFPGEDRPPCPIPTRSPTVSSSWPSRPADTTARWSRSVDATTREGGPMKLYVGPRSGNAHKVQLFLSILGLACEEIDLGYDRTLLGSPEYRARNPRQQVPILETDDGRAIWDSIAILVYLARRHGGESWLPTEPEAMAEVVQWLALSENELLYGVAQARISQTYKGGNERLVFVPIDRARALAAKGLAVMDERLAAHDWLALDRPTIAEMACFTYPAVAHEAGIDITAYSALMAWLDRVRALPGFRALPGMEAAPG